MPKSAIPMGSEFGPNQVKLARMLELAAGHAGQRDEFITAVMEEDGKHRPRKTAQNTYLSMRAYQILDKTSQLTEEGRKLLSLKDTPDEMYAEFARHILLRCRGLDVVNAVDALIKSGDEVTQLNIGDMLQRLGVYVSRSSTHVSKLIGWLHMARVFTRNGDYASLDMNKVAELIGADQSETDLLADMPVEQRAVLKALCNLPMPNVPDETPLPANKVMAYAEEMYGVEFNPKAFPRDVLMPLADAGYIRLEKAGPQISGKPYLIYRIEKFSNEVLEPLIDAVADTGIPLRRLVRKPLSEIRSELKSSDTSIKGKALEALALYFMRLLGLELKGWRKRGEKTRGFEVDGIAEGARLVFSRWQLQCKNTPDSNVDTEDIAKEVGLAPPLRSNVILMVTTGGYTRDALRYADVMMKLTNLNIITLTGHDLDVLQESPLAIVDILNRKAARVMELKSLDDEGRGQ